MIYTVTFSPAIDQTAQIPDFRLNTVNRITALRSDAGGKGINVSKTLHMLGRASVATGFLGGEAGRRLGQLLDAAGLTRDFVWTRAETRTNLKIVDGSRNTYTDINQPAPAVTEAELDALWRRLTQAKEGDWVALCGRLCPGMTADRMQAWVWDLKARGVHVALDAEGDALTAGLSACPDLIKPNAEELGGVLGQTIETAQEAAAAAQSLCQKGIGMVAVSMGAKGAVLADASAAYQACAPKVQVQSTVGAGDAMLAALLDGAARGMTLPQRLAWGVAVSAATVTTEGTQVADKAAVDALASRVEAVRLDLPAD